MINLDFKLDNSPISQMKGTLSQDEKRKRDEINQIFVERENKNQEDLKNQQKELDNKIKKQLKENKKQLSEKIQLKENEEIPSIVELQKQYEILEKELESYSELSEIDDPQIKSLDRQILSLKNAKKAANSLHEKKINTLISEYDEQITKENERFNNKLKEIENYDYKAEEKKVMKKISNVKDEIEELKKMKEELYIQKIQNAEMLDNAKKEKSAAFVNSIEYLQKQIDDINSQKAAVEKNIQNSQVQFMQEQKKLKNDLTKSSSKNKNHIKELKNSGNSIVSEKKIEHLDKLDKIQVMFMETRDEIAKQNISLKEESQMIKSRNLILIEDTQKQYEKEIEKLKTQLIGYKGLYEEREAVARERNIKAKLKSKNIKVLTKLAQDLENQFNSSLSELALAKQKLKEFEQEHENSSSSDLIHSNPKLIMTPKIKGDVWSKPFQ